MTKSEPSLCVWGGGEVGVSSGTVLHPVEKKRGDKRERNENREKGAGGEGG